MHVFLAVVATLALVLTETAAQSDPRIVAAVVEYMLPILNDLKDSVTQLESSYDNLRHAVSNLEDTVEEHESQTTSELADIKSCIANPPIEVICIEVRNKLIPYLDNVEREVCREIVGSNNNLATTLSAINGSVDYLTDKVCNVSDQLEDVHELLEEHDENSPTPITCGGPGWRLAAYLNMTDPSSECPPGWQHCSNCSDATCGQVSSDILTCDSAFFPVTGGSYDKVCGKIIGYQYDDTDAFEAYDDGEATTINEAYVSGVSLTHGSPGSRQHIWTFAAGGTEATSYFPAKYHNGNCPCDTLINIAIPPFVGEDYFCESGNNFRGFKDICYKDDPLWDGLGCNSRSTCCSFNDPPYFTKQLSKPTTDDIEARICHYGNGDVKIKFIEIYVM